MNIIETLRQKGITCCTVISYFPYLLLDDIWPYLKFEHLSDSDITQFERIALNCDSLEAIEKHLKCEFTSVFFWDRRNPVSLEQLIIEKLNDE